MYEFTLSWSKLRAWTLQKGQKRKKIILKEVSGKVNSGSFVAVMGGSGSGKTTFLGAISCKIKNRSGMVMFNDEIVDENDLNTLSGYVYQDEIFPEALTVEEHTKFLSALMLFNKTKARREVTVECLIKELNLQTCKKTSIENLSGGERRRLSLAGALLNDPLILFCDEPTTGLDSVSATVIIKFLQKIASRGKIVMATIHQPSSQLFDYFNRVILLTDGRVVFQGDKSEMADAFFNENLVCPQLYNPVDFYIKCITSKNDKSSDLVERLYRKYSFTKIAFTTNHFNKRSAFGDFDAVVGDRGVFFEVSWLIWRSFKSTNRNFRHHLFHFGLLMLTAVILGVIYANVGDDSGQDISGLLYLVVSELIFTHMYSVIYAFPSELSLSLREKGLYGPCSYFLSKMVSFMPKNVLQPLAYLMIVFYFVDAFKGVDFFSLMFLIVFFASIAGSTLGLCLSTVFTSLDYLELFIVPFDLLTMTMSGVWINVRTLPKFLIWAKYLSPFFYSYEALSVTYWDYVKNNECTSDVDRCYNNSTHVLQNTGFRSDKHQILWNVFYLSILSTIYSIIGYLGIVKNNVSSDLH